MTKPKKKPQDHATKKTKPKITKIDGGQQIVFPDLPRKTAAGAPIRDDDGELEPLTVTVRNEALDDFELLEDLNEVREDPARMPSLLRRLVGDEYADVMNAHRNSQGRVQIEPISEFLKVMLGAINPN